MTAPGARRSLIVRLVGISLALLLIVQAAGFAVVRATIDRNARSQIARELDVDENVWRRLLEQHAERLRQGAALLAADYGFRSAVGSGDKDTLQSALQNHGERIGAAVAALLDPRLNVRAVSMAPGMGDAQAVLAQVMPALSGPQPGGQVAVVGGLPYQFVRVPLKAPVLVGWVVMGFPLHQPLADEMRQLLSVQVALRVRGADGAWAVPVSTLAPEPLAQLRRARGTVTELASGDGGTLLARSSVLASGPGGEAQALLLRSVDEVLAPYRQLQLLLAAITAAGLLLFAVGSGLMARRVTTPLRSLVLGTQRLSRGEYGVPVAHTDRRDEIGHLARSFDRMRLDIAAQQEKVRQLAYWDRLTGLPNRERFRDAVLQAMAASDPQGPGLAVLTLDLDRFKHVNDVLGYAFGDQLLQAVAERLRAQLRAPGDMVARLGGNDLRAAAAAHRRGVRAGAGAGHRPGVRAAAGAGGTDRGPERRHRHRLLAGRCGRRRHAAEPLRDRHVRRQAPARGAAALRPGVRFGQRPDAVAADRAAPRRRAR